MRSSGLTRGFFLSHEEEEEEEEETPLSEEEDEDEDSAGRGAASGIRTVAAAAEGATAEAAVEAWNVNKWCTVVKCKHLFPPWC